MEFSALELVLIVFYLLKVELFERDYSQLKQEVYSHNMIQLLSDALQRANDLRSLEIVRY